MTKHYLSIILLLCTFGVTVISHNVIANTEQHGKAHTDNHADLHDEHKDEHKDEHGHGHKEEGHVEVTVTDAKKAGIVNATAGATLIKNSFTVYGRSVIKADAISQVSARYPGLITQLTVNVGDVVKAGDIVAEVESSISLKHYNILASISGVVTARHANPGELTGNQPLITIENYQHLWGEFSIFPNQQVLLEKGQKVTVLSASAKQESSILYLMANKNKPYITAITAIDNSDADGNKKLWSPGQMLTGNIVTSETEVSVAVDNRAFQEVEGKNVIFIVNANGYETRELTLGITDGSFTEVLSGVNAGEQYAVVNSYLLKADLGKAGAAHVH